MLIGDFSPLSPAIYEFSFEAQIVVQVVTVVKEERYRLLEAINP